MNIRRKVLGRGLDSLFSPSSESKATKTHKPSIVLFLGIERIQVNPNQPRRVFDKEFLRELANSIKKNGLIQPIIVKKAGLHYEIVAGERRWRAAAMAGLHEVPVRVLESKQDSVFLPLVENLQRQDLNPVELAQAYKKLMEEKQLTQEKLADHLGIPRATLANQLRILHLSLEVRNLILEGQLSLALAKILLQEKDVSSQVKWARYFAKHKTGVREAQKLLSCRQSKRSVNESQKQKPWQNQAISKIQEVHGIKSRLQFKKNGGELCLRFFSEEELKRLMDLLLKTDLG